jgi:hypothetical protein
MSEASVYGRSSKCLWKGLREALYVFLNIRGIIVLLVGLQRLSVVSCIRECWVEGGRKPEVETSFHYSDSRFFIGWIRTDDRNAVVYMALKRQNEEEENVKGREMGRGCFSLREWRQGWIPGWGTGTHRTGSGIAEAFPPPFSRNSQTTHPHWPCTAACVSPLSEVN